MKRKADKWKKADGKARFVRSRDEGYLKVSFFGPFYGAYVIFELDHENYQHAFVTSSNRSYLWLLSRKPQVNRKLMQHFLARTAELGFDTEKIIIVEHENKVRTNGS